MTSIIDIAYAISDTLVDWVSVFGEFGILCILAITPIINPFLNGE